MIGVSDTRGIRTPDQRLRVFVSSTLKELAPERLAARGSIERLHLAPVMFELGARPHPPREVYRAYLEQSDVFVGIYWQEYGWIAPDEQISGLEDEYRLASREMPKLVYVKQPAEREERLAGLLTCRGVVKIRRARQWWIRQRHAHRLCDAHTRHGSGRGESLDRHLYEVLHQPGPES